MVSDFVARRSSIIKMQRNTVIIYIVAYVAAAIILFGYGGKLSELATAQVALISLDGIIKMTSIIFSMILVAIIFFPGLLILALEIWAYFELRKYRNII